MAGKKRRKVVPLFFTEFVKDWNECLDVEDLQRALEPFGIVVTDHPACDGQDAQGFIFSSRRLTKAELKEREEAR